MGIHTPSLQCIILSDGSVNTVKTNPCFRYKVKIGEERDVIFEDVSTTISKESSRQDLFIDVIVNRLDFKNNHMTFSPCLAFIPKKGMWNYRRQGSVYSKIGKFLLSLRTFR